MKSRRLLPAVVVLLCFQVPAQTAQSPAASPQAKFEVASIRLNPSTECCTTWTTAYPANRFTASGTTLNLLTAISYRVNNKNISGGPGWFDSQRYDISAKVEGDLGITREQMELLLQNLLEQRFHLVAHREQKLVSGYALVVTKAGFKMQPKKAGDGDESKRHPILQVLPNQLLGLDASSSDLAGLLGIPTGEPVVDKTGITGNYDIKADYSTVRFPKDGLPDLFTAVQEQLGLKLVPEKVPIDFLVIDHVDRNPTEN